jgi:hypothetical protein
VPGAVMMIFTSAGNTISFRVWAAERGSAGSGLHPVRFVAGLFPHEGAST